MAQHLTSCRIVGSGRVPASVLRLVIVRGQASDRGSVIVPERETDQDPVIGTTVARTDGRISRITDRTALKTGRKSVITGGTEDRRFASRRATTVMGAATGTAMISGGHIPIPAGNTVLA